MKRFQFRLERVLRLKEQRERLAELRQQQARLAVEAARARVSLLQEELTRAARSLQDKVGRAAASGEWVAGAEHTARLGKALGAAEADVRRADEDLRAAAVERTRVATEVEALLHLRQEAWQVHHEEAQRDEQERLDELGMRRWQREQTPGRPGTAAGGGGDG